MKRHSQISWTRPNTYNWPLLYLLRKFPNILIFVDQKAATAWKSCKAKYSNKKHRHFADLRIELFFVSNRAFFFCHQRRVLVRSREACFRQTWCSAGQLAFVDGFAGLERMPALRDKGCFTLFFYSTFFTDNIPYVYSYVFESRWYRTGTQSWIWHVIWQIPGHWYGRTANVHVVRTDRG